jgi:DNA-binding Lrp family transcriptional regulator
MALKGAACNVITAYMLIQTEAGQAGAVAAALRDVPGVSEAASVVGPYDVIARAQARNVDELGKLVVAQVQALSGVERTLTCPVVHL